MSLKFCPYPECLQASREIFVMLNCSKQSLNLFPEQLPWKVWKASESGAIPLHSAHQGYLPENNSSENFQQRCWTGRK